MAGRRREGSHRPSFQVRKAPGGPAHHAALGVEVGAERPPDEMPCLWVDESAETLPSSLMPPRVTRGDSSVGI